MSDTSRGPERENETPAWGVAFTKWVKDQGGVGVLDPFHNRQETMVVARGDHLVIKVPGEGEFPIKPEDAAEDRRLWEEIYTPPPIRG